jgi:hypothetical protein
MSNALVPFDEQEKMAGVIAKSRLFGFKDPTEVLALMAVAQAEGRHPASVAKDYHVIQGRPALRADAMLARFQAAGGSVKWLKYADDEVTAEFSHPQGGSLTLSWTIKQARDIGLAGKDNWKNYPRAMLRARVISEGIRTVYPGVLTGEYTPEEVMDFEPAKAVYQDVPLTIEASPVADGVNLYVPDADGSLKLYKTCQSDEEWRDTYLGLLDKVRESKKLSDAEKSEKILALTDANKELVERIVLGNDEEIENGEAA